MNILELAKEIGLDPKLAASTGGGEYKSPCPACGGKDRFVIWNRDGRYWCRQCNAKGDLIQFCREFLHLSYLDACKKVVQNPKSPYSPKEHGNRYFVPKAVSLLHAQWQKMAQNFITISHLALIQNAMALKFFQERGFSLATVEKFLLGWNDADHFEDKNLWGFSLAECEKKLWLPRGLVVPTFFEGVLSKIKIRRVDWVSDDKYPKYVEVSGSSKILSFYGNTCLPIVLVESELDAILIQQCAGDLCCCVALGGCGKRPDAYSDRVLRNASIILFSLDFDDAGKKNFLFWKTAYSQIKPWPVPREKSPGDYHVNNGCLKKWIEAGINNYLKK